MTFVARVTEAESKALRDFMQYHSFITEAVERAKLEKDARTLQDATDLRTAFVAVSDQKSFDLSVLLSAMGHAFYSQSPSLSQDHLQCVAEVTALSVSTENRQDGEKLLRPFVEAYPGWAQTILNREMVLLVDRENDLKGRYEALDVVVSLTKSGLFLDESVQKSLAQTAVVELIQAREAGMVPIFSSLFHIRLVDALSCAGAQSYDQGETAQGVLALYQLDHPSHHVRDEAEKGIKKIKTRFANKDRLVIGA